MKDPVDYIAAVLRGFPGIVADIDRDRIVVRSGPGADAIEVRFESRGRAHLVGIEGWHDHFEDAGEAISAFRFALTGDYRIEIGFRGAAQVRWSLQVRSGQGWETDSTVGLFLVPFWRGSRTEHRYSRPFDELKPDDAWREPRH